VSVRYGQEASAGRSLGHDRPLCRLSLRGPKVGVRRTHFGIGYVQRVQEVRTK
jgi:hypothetical protein